MRSNPDLVVDSVTGVDVVLPIAGPGARSFAFLIDWHIRTILAIAWYVVGALLYNRGWKLAGPLNPDSAWFVYVIMPPAAIYFLYHPVWEVLTRGKTPGKRMAGIQTVTRDGGAPSVGALLTRNVFRLVDSFPAAYAVGLITTFITRNRVRIGDLAAGTILVYARADTECVDVRRAAANRLDISSAEVVADLLRRWEKLDANARRRLAEAVLAEVPAGAQARAASAALAPGARAATADATLHSQLAHLTAGETP